MEASPAFHVLVVQVLPGPSLAAWHDCLRIVLAHTNVPAYTTPALLLSRLKDYPHAHRTPRPLKVEFDSTEPGPVFATLATALLTAARHIAGARHITPIHPQATEIVLEIMTPESAVALAQMALALTRVVFSADSAAPWSDPLWKTLRDLCPRTSQYHAQDRRITARQMGLHCEVGGGLHRAQYRVGQGRWSQLMANAYSATTSHLGKDLAGDKIRSRTALARAGLPVPAQRRVASADEAMQEAVALGFPVVLKPSGSRASQGVFTMLRTVATVEKVYRRLADGHPEVIVEKQIMGNDYRLLVVGGRCVAAAQRLHPAVTGDGASTLTELVAADNQIHGRDGIFLAPIDFDAETLQTLSDQNLQPDSIPLAGVQVVLRRAACPSSLARDVSDQIHPSLLRLAEQAAAAVQLDLAGVDLVCADATRPWTDVETAIVEINAGPGLDINRFPDLGEPRPVARHILRSAVRAGQHGNIPVVSVLGRYGKQQCAQALAGMLRLSGLEARVADNLRAPFPSPLPLYQGTVRSWVGGWLSRTDIEALVLPLPWSALAWEGMPVQQHTIAILVDDGGSFHVLEKEMVLPDVQARLYRMVCDAASTGVVFDADSEPLRAATAHMPPHTTVASMRAQAPGAPTEWLQHYLQRGGEAIVTVPAPGGASSLYLALATGDWQQLLTTDTRWQPPIGPQETHTLALALAAMRLLGHGPASLQALATLGALPHTAQGWVPPEDPWTLKIPTASAALGQGLLGRLSPAANPGLQVFCEDSKPMRDALAEWSALLAPRRAAWHISPCEIPPLGGTPVRDQLLAQGWDPALVQTWLHLPPARPARVHLPQLHIVDQLRGPLLHGVSEDPLGQGGTASPRRADTLAATAGAAWLGRGYPRYWDPSRIAIEGEPAPGHLVLIEGSAHSLRAIHDIERRTREAFSQGAQAVMSAVMPPELPRWMPFLLSDDPTRSLYQIAQSARARYTGAVTVLLAPPPAPSLSYAALAQQGQMALDPVFHTPRSTEYAHRTALALARTRDADDEAPGGLLLPCAWRIDEITLAQPNHCVVLADGVRTLDQLAAVLPALCTASITIVGLHPSQHAACIDLLHNSQSRPHSARLVPTPAHALIPPALP